MFEIQTVLLSDFIDVKTPETFWQIRLNIGVDYIVQQGSGTGWEGKPTGHYEGGN